MLIRRILMSLTLISATASNADADWDYKNAHNWSNVNHKYQSCSGINQSPIDIRNTIKAKLEPLKFNYKTTAKAISHNGHTVQVDFNQGASLNIDNKTFYLHQFHIHSPSENTIKGESFPMEIHLVHASAQGELAVVALMFKEGKENAALKHIWDVLPKKVGEVRLLKDEQVAQMYLPSKLDYYRFSGSLTTPPCTEGVRWVVIKDIQHVSKQQIAAFSTLLGHPNNRPVQPLGARLILE